MASENGSTIRLTVGQAVVKYLQVQYSERDGERQRLIPTMFGIFGHGNVAGMAQGLEEYGDELPYRQTRNEQAMVHIATGYAKWMRRKSTFACTASIGPGTTNLVSGAATATGNHLPVLLFPSDHYATRHQGPVLQQIEHPISFDVGATDTLRPVSRFFDRIMRPEQLLTALPIAMRVRSVSSISSGRWRHSAGCASTSPSTSSSTRARRRCFSSSRARGRSSRSTPPARTGRSWRTSRCPTTTRAIAATPSMGSRARRASRNGATVPGDSTLRLRRASTGGASSAMSPGGRWS